MCSDIAIQMHLSSLFARRAAWCLDAGTPDAGPPCNGPDGLYVEGSCSLLAEGVRFFAPRYALWTDGAAKERYIYLPPGTSIDTTDPDQWIFPEGTMIWKNFVQTEN